MSVFERDARALFRGTSRRPAAGSGLAAASQASPGRVTVAVVDELYNGVENVPVAAPGWAGAADRR